MLLKDPRPYPATESELGDSRDIQYEDTEQMPALPKAIFSPFITPTRRYLDIEQVFNRWFVKGLKILGIFYVLALTSIFLWKLLIMVVAMK